MCKASIMNGDQNKAKVVDGHMSNTKFSGTAKGLN